jgi:hypothetical protein
MSIKSQSEALVVCSLLYKDSVPTHIYSWSGISFSLLNHILVIYHTSPHTLLYPVTYDNDHFCLLNLPISLLKLTLLADLTFNESQTFAVAEYNLFSVP